MKLLNISNEVFGQYFFTPEYLNTYLNTDKNKALVAIAPDKSVVGFLFLEHFSFKENSSHFITDQKWFNNRFKPNENLILIKHVALTASYQNKGVGKLLLNEINQYNETIVCVLWDKGKETPLRYLMNKNNFKLEHKIDKYWNQESLEKKYQCDICGDPPCNCSAEVYIKKVRN